MINLKQKAIVTLVTMTGIASLALAGCSASDRNNSSARSTNQAAHYTCSMHPEVAQDKPGDCPKCGMKLVEKR
jgi:hypothetical protein